MQIKLEYKNTIHSETDTHVYSFFKSENICGNCESPNDKKFDIINNIINDDKIDGKLGDIYNTTVFEDGKIKKIIFVGLGEREKLDIEGIRIIVDKIIKEANKIKSENIKIYPMGDFSIVKENDVIKAIAEITLLSNYKFDKYQTEKKDKTINNVFVICNKENSAKDFVELEECLNEGLILGKTTIIARKLVNEPANVLNPIELAKMAKIAGGISGFEVEILEEDRIKELNMEAFISVASASDNPHRLIVMRYRGDEDNEKDILGLVGKGVTYDSGGLSIKSNEGMQTMKCDMGGAASVIGALSAISQLKLKANVVGVIAACENMISGSSYRPGDIIKSMAGKTIAIGSTDAEGRLTIVDAINYIIEKEKATKIIDIATLTGSSIHALGRVATAVVSNNDDFYKELENASLKAGEKIWRLPIFKEYKELIKSDVADLTNSSGDPGVITAALFIGEFVQDKPWIHMDIAGTSWSNESNGYLSKGGTGTGVRTLYYLIKNINF